MDTIIFDIVWDIIHSDWFLMLIPLFLLVIILCAGLWLFQGNPEYCEAFLNGVATGLNAGRPYGY